MNGKKQTASETDFSQLYNEYESSKKITHDYFFGESCFDRTCSGKYGLPQEENHIFTCSVCGYGIRVSSFDQWLHSMRIKAFNDEERAEKTIEFNKDQIKELKAKIREIQENNKEQTIIIKVQVSRRKAIKNVLEAI